MDRLPPFDKLIALRSELESDFALGYEERRKRKKDRLDEILEMLIIAYMFGNEAANTMLFGEDTDEDEQPVLPIITEDMDSAIYRKIKDKNWEERVSGYFDAEDGTVDEIVRVVDTDLNRIYNDAVLNVGERANQGGTIRKTWETMLDDRVRDTHDYLEHMTVPIDRRFYTFDGDSAMYPGDFTLPQNNCGCRCRISLSMA